MINSLKHRNGENLMIEMNVVNEEKKYCGCSDIAKKLAEDLVEYRWNVYCFSGVQDPNNKDEIDKVREIGDDLTKQSGDDFIYDVFTCDISHCRDGISYIFGGGGNLVCENEEDEIKVEMNVVNEGKKYRGCFDIVKKLVEDMREERENVYCFSELYYDDGAKELMEEMDDELKYDESLYYKYSCEFDCCSDDILYVFYEGRLTPLEEVYRNYECTAARYRDMLEKFSK